jgi:aminoglycoside phosphotransferase (APT) family kinase protein
VTGGDRRAFDADTDADTAARYRTGLQHWLSAQIEGAAHIVVDNVEPISSVGGARRPWQFDVRYRVGDAVRSLRAVMLVKVPGGQLETELGPEFAALRVLHAHGVPTARPLWIDPDGVACGEPCFVTEWVPGTASLDLMQRPEDDPQRRAVAEGMADVAAALHAVDWEAAGVDFLPVVTRETAAIAQLDEWEDTFLRQRMEPLPTLVYAFSWLRDGVPVAPRVSMVHGDFRFGNVLYDESGVTAMLDWEMVHLGDPLEDLAWAHRTRWSLEQFLPLDEFVARYTAASGIGVDAEAFRWHRMFAEVKHTVISLTAARSFSDGRTTWLRHADRASMHAPFMTRFYEMLAAEARVS